MEAYKYYLEKLHGTEREIYIAMQKGFSENAPVFTVPRTDIKRLSEIRTMVCYDNPLILHIDKLSYVSSEAASSIKVKAAYTLDKKQYAETLHTVKKRLDKLLAPCLEMNEAEKEKFIHDVIIKNTVYDKLKKHYSHEVTGPLCHGIGVCEGIAKTFKLMCDYVGITALCVLGKGVPPEGVTGKKWEMHAWNIAVIGNSPCGVDVTFDLGVSRDIPRYDYFNIPDSIIEKSHCDIRFPVLKCRTLDYDIYSAGGMHIDSPEELEKAVRSGAKKPFRCFLRIGYETTYTILHDRIKEIVCSDERYRKFSKFTFSYNESSNVAELRFYKKDNKEKEN